MGIPLWVIGAGLSLASGLLGGGGQPQTPGQKRGFGIGGYGGGVGGNRGDIGQGGSGGGGGSPGYSAADIDAAIAAARGMHAQQIRGQLAQSNVSMASVLASAGLGSSGILSQGLAQNEAGAMSALSGMEAGLAEQRLNALMQLERDKNRGGGGGMPKFPEMPQPEKPGFWDNMGQLGGNLLMYGLLQGGGGNPLGFLGNIFGGSGNSGGGSAPQFIDNINDGTAYG